MTNKKLIEICSFSKRIICPYCGHEHKDSWEMYSLESQDGDITTCHNCSKDFFFKVHIDISFTSKKLENK